MNLERLRQQNNWTWYRASPLDVQSIVDMARDNFQTEVDAVFTINEEYYHYNIAQAVTDQLYYPHKQQLIIAKNNTTGALMAYGWVSRGTTTPYSFDEMAEARMAHTDLKLSTRTRLSLLLQMLDYWEEWVTSCGIPVLVSSTIRDDQQGFLHLHRLLNYTIKGSIAYKRLKEK